MHIDRICFILLLSLTALFIFMGESSFSPPSTMPAHRITLTKNDADLSIDIDGKEFTTYRFAKTPDDPHWQRPYFWPVRAEDGTEVTSDQTREFATDPKADHPHQRSIWVGHGDVNGANHWTQSPEKQRHMRFSKIAPDSFVEELSWDAKGGESATPVLTETRTVKIIAFSDGARGIEITSKFTAPSADAVFKCKPLNVTGVEAGLCALRIAKPIADDPDADKWITTGAPCSGEADARRTPALWCDYSGLINGKTYGAAMVGSLQNPGGVTPWHVRLFGLLAHIGPMNWTLSKGQSATFRHLIIIHSGDSAAANIDEKAQEWRLGT